MGALTNVWHRGGGRGGNLSGGVHAGLLSKPGTGGRDGGVGSSRGEEAAFDRGRGEDDGVGEKMIRVGPVSSFGPCESSENTLIRLDRTQR